MGNGCDQPPPACSGFEVRTSRAHPHSHSPAPGLTRVELRVWLAFLANVQLPGEAWKRGGDNMLWACARMPWDQLWPHVWLGAHPSGWVPSKGEIYTQ